jgi:hypothetical protein
MKQFIIKIILFVSLLTGVLAISLFTISDTIIQNSLLASLPFKHQLLDHSQSPKIVFVGGSNSSFGLNSKVVSDSCKLPVINTAIHAGIGLEYMINDIKPFIKKNDIIVLIPEYENFYTNTFYGEMELIQLIFDIYNPGTKLIDAEQWSHLIKYIPGYSAKKLKNYLFSLPKNKQRRKEIDVYDKNSFNAYGDAYIHWEMPDQNFVPLVKNKVFTGVNLKVILFIKSFQKFVNSRGARLLLLPPIMESQSFDNTQNIIDSINNMLSKNSIGFFSAPVKYKLPKKYFFNSYYHPNKNGVDIRTQLIIEDLKFFLKEKNSKH